VEVQVSVLLIKFFHSPVWQVSKGGVGHIDEVAVLILTVHAVQSGAVHHFVSRVKILILAVGVAGIPEIELQRIVVILAEIHQCVHFLVSERMLCHDGAGLVHHAGTVAGNGVVEPDAAQLTREVDAREGAACAEHKLTACCLQLPDLFDHRRAGLRFAEGHQRVVIIACQNLVLHSILPYGTVLYQYTILFIFVGVFGHKK